MSLGTAVPTINTFSGTALYEPKESPAEPTLCQKHVSYKKPIVKPSWFWARVLAALVTTIGLLGIVFYTVVGRGALEKTKALLEIIAAVTASVALVRVLAALVTTTDLLEIIIAVAVSVAFVRVPAALVTTIGLLGIVIYTVLKQGALEKTTDLLEIIIAVALSVASVTTVNALYETTETAAEPTLRQEDASHKKPIVRPSWFWAGVPAALVIKGALLAVIFTAVEQGTLEKTTDLRDIVNTVAVFVASVTTVNALYETKESPAKPMLSQKHASYKKTIVKPSWFWARVLAALVTTIGLLDIVIYTVLQQGALENTTDLLEIIIAVSVSVVSVTTFDALYETKESPAEPTLSQKHASYKKPIAKPRFWARVLAALVTTIGLLDIVIYTVVEQGALENTTDLLEIIIAVSVSVVSVTTFDALYETKESPAEPTLSQKHASYKKAIVKLSLFWVGVPVALVTAMALLNIVIYTVVKQGTLEKTTALLERLITVAVSVASVTTAVAVTSYKKRKTLYQYNSSDPQQNIPPVQRKIILVIF